VRHDADVADLGQVRRDVDGHFCEIPSELMNRCCGVFAAGAASTSYVARPV
jgi:hypothetical protein